MENNRFLFLGKPKAYYNYVRKVLVKHRSCIENIHGVTSGGLVMEPELNGDMTLYSGDRKIIKAGCKVDVSKYPLQFRDGSVMAIYQRIRYEHGACWVKESIIRFIKLDATQTVQYVFHYDTVLNVPNHPDHHLQFEYNSKVNTPRFPLRACEDLDTILQMIVRDKIAC